jgi:hypothetical protein
MNKTKGEKEKYIKRKNERGEKHSNGVSVDSTYFYVHWKYTTDIPFLLN